MPPDAASIAPRSETTSFSPESEVAISVLRDAIDAVIVIDRFGTIRFGNPAVTNLFGFELEELVGKNVNILMPQQTADQHDGFLENYLRTGRGSVIGKGREVLAQSKDGHRFPANLSVTQTTIEDEIHFVGVLRDISANRELEEENFHTLQVTSSINTVLDKFLGANIWNKRELFDEALSNLLRLCESEYGFIGEIFHNEEGIPFLRTHAITNIAWDTETRKFYKENVRKGLEFSNLETLFGVTIRSGDMVIANNPMEDPRSGGLPPGHPPLRTYLGLPIYAGGRLVGMAGVSNRESGYDEELVDALRPFLNTLGSVIVGFQNLVREHQIEQDLYQAQQKLRDLAVHDQLTGLLNRNAFLEQAEKRFSEARTQKSHISLLFVDIDHFKKINDSLGHLIGDQTLINVAHELEKQLRGADFIGRFGGEEFVIFAGSADLADGNKLGERLRAAINAMGESTVLSPVTVSIGIASTSTHGDLDNLSLVDMIEFADQACYVAKSEGRNRVRSSERDSESAAAD